MSEDQNISPKIISLTPLLNWFSFGFLGFWLLGQHLKAVRVACICLLGFFCFIIPGIILSILSAVDAFGIMQRKKKDEDYPQCAYHNALFFTIMKKFDRDAVLLER